MQFGESKQKQAEYSVMNSSLYNHGDLSKPYINDRLIGGGGFVYFGTDNLYPDVLASMYYTSSLHRAICDFKQSLVAGSGYTVDFKGTTVPEKIKEAMVMQYITKSYKKICQDLIVHARMYLRLQFDEKGNILAVNRIDPVMVRHTLSDMYGNVTKIFLKRDWSVGSSMSSLPVYDRTKLQQDCVLMHQVSSAGLLTYAIPGYATAGNWIFLDGEVSYLQKSNIQNSINPSFILNFPSTPANKEAKKKMKTEIQSAKGAAAAGRVITLFSTNRDQMPDIITASPSQNDKLFMQTSKDLRDNICFSHQINPSIMGVKTAGQLGNTEEIKTSFRIFEAAVVEPLRETLEEFYDEFIDIINKSGSITFTGIDLKLEEKTA